MLCDLDFEPLSLSLSSLPSCDLTKKTQKTLLKQQYENFSASRTESLDSIFNRLQKIVSRLAILGVVIAQEDLNSKFLRSLPSEWNTHVVVWMNKAEIETMSIDDLYNNFKLVMIQSEKKSVGLSSVSTVSPNVNIASPQDLKQIHEDDPEAIDLKWQLSLLSMRAKRECRAPRNKEGQFRNQDNTRKHGNNKDTSSKAMLAIDGVDDSKENSNDSLVKEQVPEDTSSFVESSLNVDKETIFLDKKIEFVKPKNHEKLVKKLVRYVNTAMRHYYTERPRANNIARSYTESVNAVRAKRGKPLMDDKGFVDSGFLRHMTGNIAYLSDFKEFDGGYVTFRGGAHGGRISGKGTLKTDSLDFEDVYFVNELKFNLFSVSQMCDKKNYVLFTDTECLVLSPNFKLPDETQILLKIPRKDNMYSFDMKNIVPKESLTCLVAKATLDESMLWHRRLGHINFKNINKLVKDNLVRGLPTKHFENDQTCVACLKGKQHRASCKSKVLNPITKPLFMLHMDLFGPTFVSSLMHKKYCLVVTDDYSRFTWVFFLATKDETSEILKNFIKEIENLVDKKVKIIRCDNGTEFKNKVMDDFCREKGIRREYSVARTPQQNGVAERRNRTLIEAARTIIKPHNKTPYELFRGLKPALNFMRPFRCHVTIFNTLNKLGKFDGKSDEGFLIGYSLSSKAFGVYNTRTRRVEENLHIGFLENKPMIEGNGPKWLFDIDSLTQSMNYVLVAAGTITNEFAGTQGELNAGTSTQKEEIHQDCIVMPIWKDTSYFDSPSKDVGNGEPKSAADDQKLVEDGPDNENDENDKSEDDSSPKEVNAIGQHVNTASPEVNTGHLKLNTVDPSVSTASSNDQDSPKDMFKMGASHTLEAIHLEFFSDEDEPEVDLGNILNSYTVPTTPNKRIHKDHLIKNVIGDILVDLPNGKKAIGTKWVFKNKKDERGIVIRNKARLVVQGHRQDKGIDYEEMFAPVARIEAIRLFLAYGSFMGFLVYQMDVKSAFLYRTIQEEVYVTQPPGFKEPDHPDKVYKVVKALYGLYQAPRAWYETLANYLLLLLVEELLLTKNDGNYY
ncbi:putative ribonuclease H-like domain-containing protein [Tanacetum coccineum]